MCRTKVEAVLRQWYTETQLTSKTVYCLHNIKVQLVNTTCNDIKILNGIHSENNPSQESRTNTTLLHGLFYISSRLHGFKQTKFNSSGFVRYREAHFCCKVGQDRTVIFHFLDFKPSPCVECRIAFG